MSARLWKSNYPQETSLSGDTDSRVSAIARCQARMPNLSAGFRIMNLPVRPGAKLGYS